MMKEDKNATMLIVDDNVNTLELIQRNLSGAGYTTYTAESVSSALKILENNPVDLVITDYRMPNTSGIDLVKHIKANYKNTGIIMMTGYATVKGAIEAMKAGAAEYLTKPFTEEELFKMVESVLSVLHLRQSGQVEMDTDSSPLPGLIGNSEQMKKIFKIINKAAATSATTLIYGESGTGKELIARALHYCSKRASAPFVPVNCGGVPEGLLESELFGYVKGAFTDATVTRAGFFQTANGGTIFLDEISEASLSMQVKLLRVLQNKQFSMVGDSKTHTLDVRVVAATNKDLLQLVKRGAFREDLLYRLNIITINVPPLRERREDIAVFIEHFLKKFSEEYKTKIPVISERAINVFLNYDWPGNVRELENAIQHLIVMNEGNEIDVSDLPPHMKYSAEIGRDFNHTLQDIEKEHIRNVLANVKGNKSKAAQVLGIDRKTLRLKQKKYNLADTEE